MAQARPWPPGGARSCSFSFDVSGLCLAGLGNRPVLVWDDLCFFSEDFKVLFLSSGPARGHPVLDKYQTIIFDE